MHVMPQGITNNRQKQYEQFVKINTNQQTNNILKIKYSIVRR